MQVEWWLFAYQTKKHDIDVAGSEGGQRCRVAMLWDRFSAAGGSHFQQTFDETSQGGLVDVHCTHIDVSSPDCLCCCPGADRRGDWDAGRLIGLYGGSPAPTCPWNCVSPWNSPRQSPDGCCDLVAGTPSRDLAGCWWRPGLFAGTPARASVEGDVVHLDPEVAVLELLGHQLDVDDLFGIL